MKSSKRMAAFVNIRIVSHKFWKQPRISLQSSRIITTKFFNLCGMKEIKAFNVEV